MFSELLHSRNIFQVTIWEMIRRFLRKLLKPSLVTTSPRTLRKLCCALITALCDIGLWIRKQYNCINIYTLFIHKAILTVNVAHRIARYAPTMLNLTSVSKYSKLGLFDFEFCFSFCLHRKLFVSQIYTMIQYNNISSVPPTRLKYL